MAGRFKLTRSTCIAVLTGFLLFLAVFLGRVLRQYAYDPAASIPAASICHAILTALIAAVLAAPLFAWLFLAQLRPQPCRTGLRSFFLTWLTVFISWIPCLLAFWPGLYSYDMSWQWEMFVEHDYSTHHPLLHTWLSGTLLKLGNQYFGSYNAGLALICLLQLLFLAGCAAFAMNYLRKTGLPRLPRLLALLFYLFFPFHAVLGISTTKDTCFGGLFLVVFVCVCDMVRSHTIYRGWRLAAFLAVAVLMALFRNNASYGLALTALCALSVFLLRLMTRKREWFLLHISLLFLIIILAGSALNGVMKRALDAQSGSVVEMLGVPIQQLARTYVSHAEELPEEDKEALYSYIPETALWNYKYYIVDPVKSRMDTQPVDENTKDFLRLWLRIGRQYPGEYLLAALYNTMGIWALGGDSSCSVVYDMREFYDETHTLTSHSLLPVLQRYYRWFNNENLQNHLPFVSMVFYTPTYVWCVILGAAALICKRRYYELLLPAMLGGYILTLAFGPCIMIRYLFNIILCTPVLLAAVWCGQPVQSVR